MEMLAAGFRDRTGASRAEAELRRVLDVGDRDLSMDDVGGTEEFVDGATVILGGRIRESRLEEVQTILRRHGGVILAAVPEPWGEVLSRAAPEPRGRRHGVSLKARQPARFSSPGRCGR
jgi:hypothetical protein